MSPTCPWLCTKECEYSKKKEEKVCVIQEVRLSIYYVTKRWCSAEYIVVSIFGLVLSLAAISFISDTIDEKFSAIEEITGIEFSVSQINPFK